VSANLIRDMLRAGSSPTNKNRRANRKKQIRRTGSSGALNVSLALQVLSGQAHDHGRALEGLGATSASKASGSESPTRLSVNARKQKRDSGAGPRGAMRGTCGLVNLGNTCYMNRCVQWGMWLVSALTLRPRLSGLCTDHILIFKLLLFVSLLHHCPTSALQCLSHTPLLRTYFLSSRYAMDINRSNPLGTGGKLAESFATVRLTLLLKSWNQGIMRYLRLDYS